MTSRGEFVPFLENSHFFQDSNHMTSLVRGMAKYLAAFLSIRFDPTGDRGAGSSTGQGSTLVQLMYSGGNPKYALDSRMQEAIRVLYRNYDVVSGCFRSATRLQARAYRVIVKHREDPLRNDGNVCIRESDTVEGSYDRPIDCSRHPYRRLQIGGIGHLLCETLRIHVERWLSAVDKLVRNHFDLPQSDQHEKLAMQTVIEYVATRIAGRVSKLDSNWPQSTRLSSSLCETLCKCQFVRNELFASEQVQKDVAAMRLMLALCREASDSPMVLTAVTTRRKDVLEILSAPPCELLRAFPKIQRDMQFDKLKDAFADPMADEYDLIVCVSYWKGSVHTDGLVNALELAVREALKWTPNKTYFIQAVRYVKPTTTTFRTQDCGAMLPRMGWINTREKEGWCLLNQTKLMHTRTGLDAVGLRTVLMISIVQQMFANATPESFSHGVVAGEILKPIVDACQAFARVVKSSIEQELSPLMVSVDFEVAKSQLLSWRGTEIETELQKAVLNVSFFSTQELFTVFHDKSNLRALAMQDLQAITKHHLVVKPHDAFEFVNLALTWGMALLSDYRIAMRLPYFTHSNPLRELLLTLPEVRKWHPNHGQLVISAQRMSSAPKELRKALLTLSDQKKLVQQFNTFQGTKRAYRFFSNELVQLIVPTVVQSRG